MSTFFISDLHLDASRARVTEAFYSFVETIVLPSNPSVSLYILGDFFDAWIGDDDDSEFAIDLQQKLRAYTARGATIFFQHGNRDFLVGEQFAAATGLTLLEEQTLIELDGKPTLLMHGDSLCVDDKEYMQFRAQVRTPAWQQQVLQLPLEERRGMAAQMRSQSKHMNAMKAEDIMDVNATAVHSAMLNAGVKNLIHGHTHRPAIHTFDLDGEPATRMVLGDWDSKAWYITQHQGELSLRNFPI